MLSNYPNGWSNGALNREMPIQDVHPGKVFWVGNNATVLKGEKSAEDTAKAGSFLRPFNTIDYAIGRCKANRGDVIYVRPGVSETITTDGGIDCDVAGISIIGLGHGTKRAKIVLDTAAAAAVQIAADDVSLVNLVFEASFADITNAVDVTAKNARLVNCHFQEEGANLNFVDYIVATGTTDNEADGLQILGCSGYGIDAAINSPLLINADLNDLVMEDCHWNTDHANALAMIQVATGKDLRNCRVLRNHYQSLKTSGDILIDNDTTDNNGVVAYNTAQHLDTTSEVLIDCDGVGQFENYGSGSVTASGYLLPAADS